MLGFFRDWLARLISPRYIWEFSLFSFEHPDLFLNSKAEFLKRFKTKKISVSIARVHTQADPFLIVKNNCLYIFYESQKCHAKGKIFCMASQDLEHFDEFGEVLGESHHLSYPFIFSMGNFFYMIPESAELNEVGLYKFIDFPRKLKKEKILLSGKFVDSSAFFVDNMFYLITTDLSCGSLRLYYGSNLLSGPLIEHPMSPLSVEMHSRRCAGGFVKLGANLFRFAQNSSQGYGGGVDLYKVITLNEYDYAEVFYMECPNFFSENKSVHHISTVDFKNKLIVAVDRKIKDYFINRFI